MTEINPVFRKTSKLGQIALGAFVLFFLIIYFAGIIQLLTGSYEVDETKLYKLDHLVLQGQAYEYRGGRHSSPRFEFEDTSGYDFILSDASFRAIIKKEHLSDTLKYNWVGFTAYTNTEGWEIYKKGKKNKAIEVYQLSIDNNNYIDILKTNSLTKRSVIVKTIFFSILFPLAFIYYRAAKERWKIKKLEQV